MDAGQPPSRTPPAPGAGRAARQLPVEAPQLAQGAFQGPGVGDHRTGGEHRQMPDAHVDPDDARLAVAGWDGPLDFDGERHEPAVGSAADGGGQDAGAAVFQPPRQLAGRLVSLEDADAGELDVLAVGEHLDLPGGEPAADTPVALLLAAWEAHRAAFAAAVAGVAPIPQRSGERVQATVVGLLGVLGPPGRHLLLGAVPLPSQRWKRPGHLDVLAGATLVETAGDQLQAPVVGEPGRAGMGGEAALLAWGGVQGELVGLEHRGHHGAVPRFASLVMYATISAVHDSYWPLSTAGARCVDRVVASRRRLMCARPPPAPSCPVAPG